MIITRNTSYTRTVWYGTITFPSLNLLFSLLSIMLTLSLFPVHLSVCLVFKYLSRMVPQMLPVIYILSSDVHLHQTFCRFHPPRLGRGPFCRCPEPLCCFCSLPSWGVPQPAPLIPSIPPLPFHGSIPLSSGARIPVLARENVHNR